VLPVLLACVVAVLTIADQPAVTAYTAQEIAGYRLTETAFRRFDRASRLMADAIRQDPRLAANPPFTREVSVLDDVVVAATALENRLRQEPALASALQASGIAAREYTTFALALFAARMAHGFVKSGAMRFVPEGLAKENVAFIETHEPAVAAVLQALGLEDP
jgi:hypothetical protein